MSYRDWRYSDLDPEFDDIPEWEDEENVPWQYRYPANKGPHWAPVQAIESWSSKSDPRTFHKITEGLPERPQDIAKVNVKFVDENGRVFYRNYNARQLQETGFTFDVWYEGKRAGYERSGKARYV